MGLKEVKYSDDNYGFTITTSAIATGGSSGYVYIDGLSGSTMELCWPTKYNERSKDMMGLYEVFIADKKRRVFLGKEVVVTDDGGRAIMIAAKRKEVDVENDNIVFHSNCIVQWEDKKPKEVKIVKE